LTKWFPRPRVCSCRWHKNTRKFFNFTKHFFFIQTRQISLRSMHIHCRPIENNKAQFLHWQSSRWKACETHFQQTYVNGFWIWIESYIREFRESKLYDIFTFLPSLQLSIIMWLSHLLTSSSSQRNHYLFPKYRVSHIWAERFRYGYTPC
jgi:hypothetical protein